MPLRRVQTLGGLRFLPPALQAPSMRALGPGSVSSLLKVVLDVVYFALWTALAGLALGGVGLLLASPFGDAVSGRVSLNGHLLDMRSLLHRGPQAALLLIVVEGYLASLIVVFSRLRRVFGTLTVGDPFRPENVGRLRQIGLALVLLEVLGYAVRLAVAWLTPEAASADIDFINLTAWFSILVVFVLAEVFREGARLRGEAELTI